MKKMHKRAVILLCVFFILFFSVIIRLMYLQRTISADVVNEQASRVITLGTTRGYIYDRNYNALVNNKRVKKQVILSSKETEKVLQEKLGIKNKLKKGILIDTIFDDKLFNDEYIKTFFDITRYDNNLCRHIIGYTDYNGSGVCGIEKAFDKILYENSGELKVKYTASGLNVPLVGDGMQLIDNNYDCKGGIVLTIDKEIQEIIENNLSNSNIKKGAAVVLDVNTSEILACASIPNYSINEMEKDLTNADKPFLNRAICAYPVGSVFKPVIAAAFIENGGDFSSTYECKGKIDINGNIFKCFNYNEHGLIDLNGAIENSCNTFFIICGLNIGAKEIINISEKFGFGKQIKLCSSIICDSGYLPKASELSSNSDIANICFGQGSLLATPIQIAAVYAAIANGGVYQEPYILKELVDSQMKVYGYYKSELNYRVISKKTSQLLDSFLSNNMINGTGKSGASSNFYSAGKTATAQTGRIKNNGKEELCTWFAGYFPSNLPKYALVVFNEDGTFASVDCGPVFKQISEAIMSYENSK